MAVRTRLPPRTSLLTQASAGGALCCGGAFKDAFLTKKGGGMAGVPWLLWWLRSSLSECVLLTSRPLGQLATSPARRAPRSSRGA